MRCTLPLLGALSLLVVSCALADDLPLRSGTAARCPSVPSVDQPEAPAWLAVEPLGELAAPPDDDPHSMLRADVRAAYDEAALALRIVLRGRLRTAPRAFERERVLLVLDPRNTHGACLVVEAPFGAAPVVRVVNGPAEAFATAQTAVRSTATRDAWTVTVSVPWAVLGTTPDHPPALGFDLLRFAADGRMHRWSRAVGANDADPRVTGLLWLAPPPVAVERISWAALRTGTGAARMELRNASGEPARLLLSSRVERALSAPRTESVACDLAPGESRAVDVPVTVAGSGTVGLGLEVCRREAPQAPLFSTRYTGSAEARFPVRGIGWLELKPAHRLAGRAPLTFRLRALECRPTPISQPPVEVALTLEGPDGPAHAERSREVLTVEAIELATLDRDFAFPTRELLSGAYTLRARVARGTTVLGEATQEVRVSRVIEDDLGFASAEAALSRIRSDADGPLAARLGAATLELRIQRAWRALDGTGATTEAEFIGTANAVRGELNEARAIAADLERGVRPYQGKAGTFLLAHRSPVDDTPQPYALYVPETYSDQRASPVVLQLHGYDGGNGGFGFPGGDDPVKQEAKKRGWLVLYPWGRGNQDWRDSGDTDLQALLRDLCVLYSVDVDRLFLTGISMGGRGVWHLAARHPDQWAAIVPIAGASSGQVWTVWQEERLSVNYRALPAYIVHGGSDWLVPVEDARTMYRRMLDEGSDVRYQEFATRGHEGFGDFAPTLFAWMDGIRRNPWPAVVRYDTEWLRWSRAYWVQVDGLEREGRLASIEARVASPTKVTVRTDRVTGFTVQLGPHPLLDRTRPVAVEIDGHGAYRGFLPPGGALSFARGAGGWAAVACLAADPSAKSPLSCGPMRRVFGDRFHIVYGTRGWDDDALLAAYDMARRAAERWEWWIWGAARPIADRDADDDLLGSGGLLLYGGPDVNLVARRQWEQGLPRLAGDRAWRIARPSRWNPAYLAATFDGPTAGSLRAVGDLGEAWPLPSAPMAAQDADYNVCAVDGEGRLTPVLEGCAPVDWSIPLTEAGLLLASDGSWRASRLAPGAWSRPEYDDAAWLAPVVLLRKEFDETSWHNAALHKYGRLSQSFLPPAMALKVRPHPDRPREPGGISYFRKAFDLPEPPPRATLRVYLDDEGEVYLNGSLVCAPGPTDLVGEFDVSSLLRPGRNVVAVRLANTLYDECLCLQITEEEPAHVAP